MEKNVTVIDEKGNITGTTYPKRAKGLIKKGRARLVDENTVCLACPPNENLEDIKMENSIEKTVNGTEKEEITLKYVLDKLDELRESFLKAETEQIISIDSPSNYDTDNVDIDSEDLASIYREYYGKISDIKMSSQTSLQQMIGVYDKLIDRLAPKRQSASKEDRDGFMDFVRKCVENAPQGNLALPDFEKLFHTMYG